MSREHKSEALGMPHPSAPPSLTRPGPINPDRGTGTSVPPRPGSCSNRMARRAPPSAFLTASRSFAPGQRGALPLHPGLKCPEEGDTARIVQVTLQAAPELNTTSSEKPPGCHTPSPDHCLTTLCFIHLLPLQPATVTPHTHTPSPQHTEGAIQGAVSEITQDKCFPPCHKRS